MSYHLFIVGLLIGIIGCSSTPKKTANGKFDSPLIQKISEVEKSENPGRISVFGKCSEGITGTMQQEMEATGVKINSVIGNIFTGDGTPEELRTLSGIEFIHQIHLSTESKPL